jgi:hypothetical protein
MAALRASRLGQTIHELRAQSQLIVENPAIAGNDRGISISRKACRLELSDTKSCNEQQVRLEPSGTGCTG